MRCSKPRVNSTATGHEEYGTDPGQNGNVRPAKLVKARVHESVFKHPLVGASNTRSPANRLGSRTGDVRRMAPAGDPGWGVRLMLDTIGSGDHQPARNTSKSWACPEARSRQGE